MGLYGKVGIGLAVAAHFPENLRIVFRDILGAEPERVEAVGGGTRYFVKWNASAPPSLFEVEARGLGLLRAAGALRVPEVIAHGEATAHAPTYLILEWIESAAGVDQRLVAAAFGCGLAALHHVTGTAFGLDHDNFIGALPQRNTPTATWPEFYRDQRIAVQMEIARQSGHLPPHRERLLGKLMERIEGILDGSGNPASLLHGDLWSGNLIASNPPAVVDPAVYYGDREVEIAFTEMFGGGSAFFQDAYREAYPLDAGYAYRRPLLQLYPMLVHLNHFGESYGSGVDGICRGYLG